MSQMTPFTIDKFLGVNKTSTETLLQLGEASDMSNWIITDDMKLQKTPGYTSLFETIPYPIKTIGAVSDIWDPTTGEFIQNISEMTITDSDITALPGIKVIGNSVQLANTIATDLEELVLDGETVGKSVVFGSNYIQIRGATNPFTAGTLTGAGLSTTANNKGAAITSVSGQYIYFAAGTWTPAVEFQGTLSDGTNTLQISVSPSAPQTLTSITSNFDLFGSGKNMLFYPYNQTTFTANGITFTDNRDGSITINGTATADALFAYSANEKIPLTKSILTFGQNVSISGVMQQFDLYDDLSYKSTVTLNSSTLYKTQDVLSYSKPLYKGARIRVASGVTVNNVKLYTQIEAGTVPTAYEAYNGTKQTITLKDTNGNALENRGLVATYNTDGSAATFTAQDYVFRDVDGKWKLASYTSSFTLQSSDFDNFYTTYTNTDMVSINKKANSSTYGVTDTSQSVALKQMMEKFRPIAFADSSASIGGFFNRVDGVHIGLLVAKGTYADLNAAKAALTGMKIIYQLATPTITELHSDNQTAFTAAAKSFDGITNITLGVAYGKLEVTPRYIQKTNCCIVRLKIMTNTNFTDDENQEKVLIPGYGEAAQVLGSYDDESNASKFYLTSEQRAYVIFPTGTTLTAIKSALIGKVLSYVLASGIITYHDIPGKINGIWYGELSGTNHFLFSCNGHIYEHNLSTGSNTDCGAMADALTTFFVSNNTVYILDGTEFYKWTGSGSIVQVIGYIPTVYTAGTPAGGGTILESINYLIGTKIKKISGDNVATVYQLPELSINSVDSVTVNGVLQTVTTHYTVNLTAGTVTFVTKPPLGVNNVVITWTKTTAGDRAIITNNMYYGGAYYSRFWLFGNPTYKNARYPSGITMSGVSDPSYWPKFADSTVGEYEITDIVLQYNKQIIYTNGDSGSSSAWYSEEEDYTDSTTGAITALFPIYPMSAKFGNVAKGQTQIIMNNPFTIDKGVYEWVSTYISNEKNAMWKSQRIQNDLDLVDLTTAITCDWNDKGQYWLCVGQKVWVYNYRIDAWYVLDLPHTPTCFAICEADLYIGMSTGEIMKLSKDELTFDGTEISAYWNMGFTNFGADWIRKFLQRIYLTLLPLTTTHVDVSYETDIDNTSDTYTASYALGSFETWDFSNFDFTQEYSPQPFKFKIRAKKIDYFKLKLTTSGTDSATVLSVTLPVRQGGEVRGN